MTFDEIVDRVLQRTNLTSTEARTRVGIEVNEVYKDLVSSMGMETTVRGVTLGLTESDSRYVTFGVDGDVPDKVIKLMSVFLPTTIAPPPYNVLTSATFDELRNTIPGTWPPMRYAISKTGATTVEIFLDAQAPPAPLVGPYVPLQLYADCMLASDTMEDTDQPFFPENFHDALVYGTMVIELDKMEKEERAAAAQVKFDRRASELRMFIAKDAYLAIHQAKTQQGWIGTQLIPS